MDPEAFLDMANQVCDSLSHAHPHHGGWQVTKLKMYPYFDLAHAALCCLAVRDDLANGIFIIIAFVLLWQEHSVQLDCQAPFLSRGSIRLPFGVLQCLSYLQVSP